MSSLLKFKGTWRTYQARILQRVDRYLDNDKIHIVAAPGSGKTTLGIEIIGRLDKPTLILAPSITIREQWISRIEEAFLKEGVVADDVISNSIKNPKFITVATYQSLHSAMTKKKAEKTQNEENGFDDEKEESSVEAEEDILDDENEIEDYSDFELVKVMKDNKLDVICLDECHHLRSEWWKALENFQTSFKNAKVIALTATPPYDSKPAMWNRYINVCGDIDEEITIPELVKEGSLCPHQDYVMFNYPTKDEIQQIDIFEEKSQKMLGQLMADNELLEVIKSYDGLFGQREDDKLLENPAYLSAVLIYLQEKQVEFPKRLMRLLGAKKLPKMDEKWMEYLLQSCLYENTEAFVCEKSYREKLISSLKAEGLLEKKKVCMAKSTAVEKMLITSKGKIESIKEITFKEYDSMGKNLRLLILTDYIRKDSIKNLGNQDCEMNQLGVLPFFEVLRREEEKLGLKADRIGLGVLCGSIVIIPAAAKNTLLSLVGEDKVSFSQAGMLSMDEYVLVEAKGDNHFLTAAVTEIFTLGYIQVLVGTKSLLGEGWDAPCVNSLILASFVGSFMLSNQMRGRAIRIDKNNPNKTSNIWHLVCINPIKYMDTDKKVHISEDFEMLERRMEHFMGLSYEEDTIENGIARLTYIKPPYGKLNIQMINKKMLSLSEKREELKLRWRESLAILNKVEIASEVDIADNFITVAAFYDAIKATAIFALAFFGMILLRFGYFIGELGAVGMAINIALGIGLLISLLKTFRLGSPLKRLKIFGKGIRKAMLEKKMLSDEHCKVEVDSIDGILYGICLNGGSGKDKDDFAKCVLQFFSEIDNQRYILVNKHRKNKLDGFFAVPDSFSKKREDAELFTECIKSLVGKYDLIYTRNAEGRQLLLEARIKALANKEERWIKKKKAKSSLE